MILKTTETGRMDCGTAEYLFRMHAEGRLPAEDSAALERHLAGCARCRKIHERETAYIRLMEGVFAKQGIPPRLAAPASERLLEPTRIADLVEQDAGVAESEEEAPARTELEPETLTPAPAEAAADEDEERFVPFYERLGAAPWWAISGTFHGLLLLLLGLLSMVAMRDDSQETVITTDLTKAKPSEFDEKKPRDVFRNPVPTPTETPTEIERPVVPHEKVEDTSHNETEDNMDTSTARGDPNAISDLPLGGLGTSAAIGLGGGGAGHFGQRSGGGKKKALMAGGGGKATESAVEAALRWLARHQEEDGRWRAGIDQDMGGRTEFKDYDVAMTGLALLAFLGAGHTEKAGQYRTNVQRGVYWLISKQAEDGSWKGTCSESRFMYEHGIATLALAEAYGMARVPDTGRAAQKAIDFAQQAQHEYAAWDYRPNRETNARNDTSVSGWNVMALKSAKIAGLKVDPQAFMGAIAWLDAGQKIPKNAAKSAGTDFAGGEMAYCGNVKGEGLTYHGIAMTAAGALMRQFLGFKRDDPSVMGPANLMMKELPVWKAGDHYGGPGNMYYWYYATLVMFQMGGDHWKQWNEAMKAAILPNQRRGGDEDGSWDPLPGGYVKFGGRVMSTALCCLCLEVYYRYLPMYR